MGNEGPLSGHSSAGLFAVEQGAPWRRRLILIVASGLLIVACVVVGSVRLSNHFAPEIEKVLMRAAATERRAAATRAINVTAHAGTAGRATPPRPANVVHAYLSVTEPRTLVEHWFGMGKGVLLSVDDAPDRVRLLLDRFSPGTEPLRLMTVASYQAWRRTLPRPQESLTRTKDGKRLLIRTWPDGDVLRGATLALYADTHEIAGLTLYGRRDHVDLHLGPPPTDSTPLESQASSESRR